jgi:hypothetical protein
MNEEPDSPLGRALSALPKGRAPATDLWPGIARAIRRRQRIRRVIGSGAVLVLAGILAVSLRPLVSGRSPEKTTFAHGARPFALAAGFVGRAARDPALPLPVRESLPADLRVLDQARAAIERRLVRHPGAPVVRGLLVWVETKRAIFLTTVENAQLHARNWQ